MSLYPQDSQALLEELGSLNPLEAIIFWQNVRIQTYKMFHEVHQEMQTGIISRLDINTSHNKRNGDDSHDHHGTMHNHEHSTHGHSHHDCDKSTATKTNKDMLQNYQQKLGAITQRFNECNLGIRTALLAIDEMLLYPSYHGEAELDAPSKLEQEDKNEEKSIGHRPSYAQNWDSNLVQIVEELLHWESILFQGEVKKMRLENDTPSTEEIIGEKTIPKQKEYTQILKSIGEARENINDLMSELKQISYVE